ncbi:ankyrin repeat-containing domain protein [Trichophaea hybrida]|nr:ankyrin repeat-containing domain protein [Trichophaea hybrida]
MKYMRTQHRFALSKFEYERQLKKWNIRKNLKQSDWEYIHRVKKRKRDGKGWLVYVGNIEIQEKKLKREISRRFPPAFGQRFVPGLQTRHRTGHRTRPYRPLSNPIAIPPATTVMGGAQPITNVNAAVMDTRVITARTYAHGRKTVLQRATATGNIELVRILLAKGADVNTPALYIKGRTALQAAAENGNIELVQILLASGADVNAPAAVDCGRTALQSAAERGYVELVRILLLAGAKVNAAAASNRGMSALQAAAITNTIDLVRSLLAEGADVNADNGFSTTLSTAAILGCYVEILETLIHVGADVNPDHGYGSALHIAAENRHIDAGVDVNASHRNRPALWHAVLRNNIELAQILMDAGADVNPLASGGTFRTVLHGAAIEGNIELVQILIKSGADVNAPPAYGSGGFQTALAAAVYSCNTKMVQIRRDSGAEINALSSSGGNNTTALQVTVKRDNMELARLLINAGAEVNAPASNGEYDKYDALYQFFEDFKSGGAALQIAAFDGNLELVRLLIDFNANVNAPGSSGQHGRTTIQAAIWVRKSMNQLPTADLGEQHFRQQWRRSNGGITAFLLNAGADVNALPSEYEGRTVIGAAAEHGRLDMVQLLLNAGADLHHPGNMCHGTPVELATHNGHHVVANILRGYQNL